MSFVFPVSSPLNMSLASTSSGSSISTMNDSVSPVPPLGSPVSFAGSPATVQTAVVAIQRFSFPSETALKAGQQGVVRLLQHAKIVPLPAEQASVPSLDLKGTEDRPAAAGSAPLMTDDPAPVAKSCLGKRGREITPPVAGLLSPPPTPELRPSKEGMIKDEAQLQRQCNLEEMAKRLKAAVANREEEEVDLWTIPLEFPLLPLSTEGAAAATGQ